MPMLTLKFKKNTIADYPLQKGKSVTIGRRTNNDIVVENRAVSGHHAKIAEWRRTQSEALTKARRPDLWAAWEARKGEG